MNKFLSFCYFTMLALSFTSLVSCKDEKEDLDIDYFMPIQVVQGDSISIDKSDTIRFKTGNINSALSSYFVVEYDDQSGEYMPSGSGIPSYSSETWPVIILENEKLKISQDDDVTYTMTTKPLHHKAIYSFTIVCNDKQFQYYLPSGFRLCTRGMTDEEVSKALEALNK